MTMSQIKHKLAGHIKSERYKTEIIVKSKPNMIQTWKIALIDGNKVIERSQSIKATFIIILVTKMGKNLKNGHFFTKKIT